MASDELVWERIKQMLPLHDCGRRLEPGGIEGLGHALVCVPCSHVSMVDEEWVAELVDEARAAIEGEAT